MASFFELPPQAELPSVFQSCASLLQSLIHIYEIPAGDPQLTNAVIDSTLLDHERVNSVLQRINNGAFQKFLESKQLTQRLTAVQQQLLDVSMSRLAVKVESTTPPPAPAPAATPAHMPSMEPHHQVDVPSAPPASPTIHGAPSRRLLPSARQLGLPFLLLQLPMNLPLMPSSSIAR